MNLKPCEPFTPFTRHTTSDKRAVRLIPKAKSVKRRSADNNDDDNINNQNPENQSTTRREIIMGAVNLAILGDAAASIDGRTVVNSILGAYGLPQLLPAAKGFNIYDDFDLEYVFQYPKSWVQRKNTLRPGLYIADFNTADKLTTETFPLTNVGSSTSSNGGGGDSSTSSNGVNMESGEFIEAVISKLLNPAAEIGGDSRLELPPKSRIKTSKTTIDGQTYLYITFPSETITRSGYQVRRKNIAVAGIKRDTIYTLGVSARSDQYNTDKEQVMRQIVESFRLR